jgi:SAM-dependent methyltransferase
MWLFLQQKTDFFTRPKRVLHVAPEQCFHQKFKNLGHLDYITADLDSPLADVNLDVQQMPFSDNDFDVVFCNHVLEHVEDDKKAMREILRVLKPGGYAILQVPIDFNRETTYEDHTITDRREREKHFLQYDHLRLYGRDYPQQVTNEGFVIKEKNYLDQFTDEQRDNYRLPNQEHMYAFFKE